MATLRYVMTIDDGMDVYQFESDDRTGMEQRRIAGIERGENIGPIYERLTDTVVTAQLAALTKDVAAIKHVLWVNLHPSGFNFTHRIKREAWDRLFNGGEV